MSVLEPAGTEVIAAVAVAIVAIHWAILVRLKRELVDVCLTLCTLKAEMRDVDQLATWAKPVVVLLEIRHVSVCDRKIF